MLYSVTTSSTLIFIGVRLVRMQSASWDVVRYALAILKLMSLCTLTYLATLHSFLMGSMHTGAAHSSCGSVAPLYIAVSASRLCPQLILADLHNAFISLVHLPVTYFICSLNLNLLSIIIPKYFILSTYSRWLLFMYISTAFLSLRLLGIRITSDF